MQTMKKEVTEFENDIVQGLTSQPKKLSSKYFYDTKGDLLFQQIMAMPEYYLTRAEQSIFDNCKGPIAEAIADQAIDIIELGAGDGTKTRTLLKELTHRQIDFRYIPSDISPNILAELKHGLLEELPALNIHLLPGDYFQSLSTLPERNNRKRIFFYLGSNIGNLEKNAAVDFLNFLRQFMQSGDQLLIGIDLKKDPAKILAAYNDPTGHTAAFNLNLLTRINNEMDANFDTSQFRHWESYDPLTGAARSYIISEQIQTVQLKSVDRSIHFDAWEAIQVELSQKYSPAEVDELALAAGYTRAEHFFDSESGFVDSLWNF